MSELRIIMDDTDDEEGTLVHFRVSFTRYVDLAEVLFFRVLCVLRNSDRYYCQNRGRHGRHGRGSFTFQVYFHKMRRC